MAAKDKKPPAAFFLPFAFISSVRLLQSQVTTKSSVQWKLLLETKPPLADRQWARDNELEDMGFEKLDVSHLRNSIMNPFGQHQQVSPLSHTACARASRTMRQRTFGVGTHL